MITKILSNKLAGVGIDRRKKKKIGLFSLLFILSLHLNGYSEEVVGAARYLRIGVGARQLAMGAAGVALGEDAASTYWNPANLVTVGKREVSMMHSWLSLDRKHQYIGYIQPAGTLGGERGFGIAVIHFSIENLREIIKEEEPIPVDKEIGKFKQRELALLLSYAIKKQANLSFGATLKYLDDQFIGLKNPKRKGDSAYGTSLDLGVLWRPQQKFTLGFVFQDLASSLRWDTGRQESLPLDIRLGGVYHGYLFAHKPLIIALDLEYVTTDDRIRPHIGVELSQLLNVLALRCGLNDAFPTAGLGINLFTGNFNLRVDYSFAPDAFSGWEKIDNKYNHRLALSIRF